MASRSCEKIWALVPAKRFSQAKMRLSSELTCSERAQLARAMLHDAMTTLSHVDELAGILVVSADPSVEHVVRPFGVQLIRDDPETGVNDAVGQGLRVLAASRTSGAIILPGDVPFVTSLEIQVLLRKMTDYPIVLAPALRDGGTNCLAMTDALAIQPCFGEDSFKAHQAAARDAGIPYGICRLEGLGNDIDCFDDMISASGRAGSHTADFLDCINAKSRVGLLQSIGRPA